MNYIKQVANILGVEVGEEFYLKNDKTTFEEKCKLTEERGLTYHYDNDNGYFESTNLEELLMGRYEVVKIPFKPKSGEYYWCYSIQGKSTMNLRWNGNTDDYTFWKAGNCFRTEKEAETKGKEIMEKIKVEYDGE